MAPDQSKPLAATPKRVVFPLMNDMKSCECSRNPIESAEPASAASAMASGTRVVGLDGKDLSIRHLSPEGVFRPRSVGPATPRVKLVPWSRLFGTVTKCVDPIIQAADRLGCRL